MALTFEPVQSVTVGAGGSSSITLSSIPGTYDDICIVLSGRGTGGSIWNFDQITINGSNGDSKALYQFGGGIASQSYGFILAGSNDSTATANTFAIASIYIPKYTASAWKSIMIDSGGEENSAGSVFTWLDGGVYKSTSAITSVAFARYNGGNYAQYSQATLYGIKNS